MRAVIQRVTRASVTVDGEIIGRIGPGMLVLLGAGHGDGPADVDYLVKKIIGLRIFEDADGRMNLALSELTDDSGQPAPGALLVVSQFTLYGDTRKGRRPAFVDALEPTAASALVDRFVERARAEGITVETGRFGADMAVELLNDGPVTLILETRDGQPVRLGGGG